MINRTLDLIPQWVTDNIWETVTGLITAAAATVAAYLKRRLDSIVEHRMNTEVCPVLVDSSWDAAEETMDTMQDLRKILSAVRVVLLVTENGNGIPLGDKAVKSSIVMESFADGDIAAKPYWQDRPTDAVYSQIVRDVYEKGEKIIETEKLPACDLKELYRKGGIVSSAILKVHHTDTRFFYLSCTMPSNQAGAFANLEEVRRVARELGSMFERNPDLARFIRFKK